MSMVTKSISVTGRQAEWLQAQLAAGPYLDESEVIRDLINERQLRDRETPADLAAIRAALGAGEDSIKREGYSQKTPAEIWQDARALHQARHG